MSDKFIEFEEGQKFSRKKPENQVIADSPDDFVNAGYVLKPDDYIIDIDKLTRITRLTFILIIN